MPPQPPSDRAARRVSRSLRTAAVAGTALTVLAVGLMPAPARAGRLVAITEEATIGNVAVGGSRVVWDASSTDEALVRASGLAANPQVVLRDRNLPDWLYAVDVELHMSDRRIAAQANGHYWIEEGDDAGAYVTTLLTATGPVWTSALRTVTPDDQGYGDLQDVSADTVVSTVARGSHPRRTARVFVRDFARGNLPRKLVGPRVTLRRDGFGSERLEARISGPWVAVLRRGRRPTITVYDWRKNRRAWSVALPRVRRENRNLEQLDRAVVWDLAADGSLAVALSMTPSSRRASPELGWVAPRGRYRRITSAVLLRAPFVIRGGRLTYARPATRSTYRLYSRAAAGPPRAVTGKISRSAVGVVSDGHLVAGVRVEERRSCLLAAVLPLPDDQRWRCPR